MGAVGGYGYSQADKFEDAANDIFVGGVSNGALSAVGPAVSKTYDKSVGKVIDKTRQWYEKSQIDRAYDQVAKNPLKGNMNDVLVRMSPYGKGEYHIQRGAAALGDDGQLVFRGKSLLKEKGTERNFGLNKIIGKHHITKEEAKMIPEAIRNKPSDIRTNEYFDGKNILKNENVGFRTKKGLDEYQLAFGKGSDNPFRLVTMHKKNRDHILTSGLSCQPERYASGGYYPVIEGWSPSGILPQVGQVINANIAHKKNKDHVSARALSPLHDGYASGGFYPNTEGWSPNGILPQVGQVVNANISHKESRGATS
ncbi:MAG: hypothetical protein LBU87_01645, partial [Lactobacillales bacterium]|nr:hypothetical protein [Lactobacillales bacterium]